MPTFRAVIYAAVSTPGQAEDHRESIPNQLATGRAAAESLGATIVAEITIPGHTRDYEYLHELVAASPEYAEFVRLIQTEAINLVICWRYDRVWRNDWLRADVVRECTRHGVQLYATQQPQMPKDPAQVKSRAGVDSLLETLSGVISEQEQQQRIQRLRMGMAGRIKRGHHHAPNAPYGYVYEGKTLAIDPETAPTLQWIFAQRASGKSITAIVHAMNDQGIPTPGLRRKTPQGRGVWGITSISRLLHNPVYTGQARWGSVVQDDAHVALVSPEIWTACQARGSRFPAASPLAETRWLRGLLRCGFCGYAMKHRTTRDSLICTQHSQSLIHPRPCRANGTVRSMVYQAVSNAILEALTNPEVWLAARQAEDNLDEVRQHIAMLEQNIARNRERYDRVYAAYEAGAISLDLLTNRRSDLDQKHAPMLAKLDELRARLAGQDDLVETLDSLRRFAPEWDKSPPKIKHQIAIALIDHIDVIQYHLPIIIWR